jgi:hypothetical protein
VIDIKFLIIHCSAGPNGDAAFMDRIHKDRWQKNPRMWHVATAGTYRYCGYQRVILNGVRDPGCVYDAKLDGKIETGRLDTEEGCHCIGYNRSSLGICVVGELDKAPMTRKQWQALVDACVRLCKQHNLPYTRILGHRETASGKAEGKTCPGLTVNMRALRTEVRDRLAG